MKKIYVLLMLLAFSLGVSAQNLVLNPGFEDWDDATTPTNWTKVESVDQESTEVHSGTYAAKHTGGTSALGQTIAVEAGKTYTLSFWYKVVESDGDDSRIWCVWQDGDGNGLYDDTQGSIRGPDDGYLSNGSGEWLQYTAEVVAPATAASLSLEVRTYSGAVTYWDDFVFEEVVETAADLFFSEYIEGGSNNKAIEIFNPEAEAIGLASYQIAQSSNGGGWEYYHVFPEDASIAAGDVYVILNSDTDPLLFDAADADEVLSWPSVVHHNGNDARAIVFITDTDTTIIDVIGIPDDDSNWDVAGVTAATKDHTIVRKDEITAGTDDWSLSAGTDAASSQWIVEAKDYFDDLGTHGPDVTAPVVTFDPEDGEETVSTSTEIIIAFDEPVFGTGGTEITDPTTLVELKETDASGTAVAFTATINAEKTEIIIVPDANLANDQLYYVALKANMVEDEEGNTVETLQSATFTTGGPIEILGIEAGSVSYIGQDVVIQWMAEETIGNITIWVSFDNGANFEPLIENIDPAPGMVDYTISDEYDPSMEVILRITEATNTTFADGEPMAESEVFYLLAMIPVPTIQGTTDANGNSSLVDTLCVTTGIVTYADGESEYYISDGEGDYSGIVVRDAVNKPVVGDSILIAGTVVEYYSLTQIDDLIEFDVIETGKSVPDPVEITTGGAGEALEGVIVKISSAEVVAETNNYGETELDDGSGVILVDDPYYAPTLNLGGTYDVTGPLSYSYGEWRVYPTEAADVTEIPSSEAAVSSTSYTVNDTDETITGIPALEDLTTFTDNITPVYGAEIEVYEADGSTVATDLQSGYLLVVTSQDGTTTKTYTITKDPLSDDATVTSLVYTVDDGAGTISGVLYNSTVASFEAYLVPAMGASFTTYQADGTTEATDIQSGYKLIVTAEDGSTTKEYTLTVDDAPPADLIFSEYIEGSGNNKAIEIFNPNENPIKLDYYQIAQLSNGGEDWEYFHLFPVGSVLNAEETWVIITDETDEALFAAGNADEVMSYPSVVHHNGDDARGLIIVTGLDTTLVDIIGTLGADPGDGWEVAGVANATKEHTLLRKGSVMEGNTDWVSSAGTNADDSEWIVKDQNFFDSLGVHTKVLPPPSDDATLSGLMVDGTAVEGFSPATLTYYVTLPPGTTTVPVVTAETTDENASVNITDATDLSGDATARTTTVEVTAEDGETVKIYTIEFTVEVSVQEEMFSMVQVYPVPAVDKLYLDNAANVQTLTLYDITGASVMQMNNAGKSRIAVDVNSLDNGVYLIRLANEKTAAVIRFVKQ